MPRHPLDAVRRRRAAARARRAGLAARRRGPRAPRRRGAGTARTPARSRRRDASGESHGVARALELRMYSVISSSSAAAASIDGLPRRGLGREVAARDRSAGEVLEPVEQRERRLRATACVRRRSAARSPRASPRGCRRLGLVGDARSGCRPGPRSVRRSRPSASRTCSFSLPREDRDRARVRHVRHHRAEQHEARDVLARARRRRTRRRSACQAARRLDAGQQCNSCAGPVPRRRPAAACRSAEDRGARPLEAPLAVAVDRDLRPRVLVVEVELGVDRGDLDEAEPLARRSCAAPDAASPASFHPSNAATSSLPPSNPAALISLQVPRFPPRTHRGPSPQ